MALVMVSFLVASSSRYSARGLRRQLYARAASAALEQRTPKLGTRFTMDPTM
jgi:hypothetical protein